MAALGVRTARAIGVGALLATALCALNPSPARATSVATAVQIPDTSYPIPTGALFVAPGGNDESPGTQSLPLRTVAHALALAPSGATIVLRTGVYRESLGNIARPVTIQPYPHEQAWLSGSDVVTGWTAVGAAWVHHDWTAQFCRTCYPAKGALDSRYPLAGWPDQVFFNGAPLTQAADLAHLTPGTFYVDYANHDLYVGSDPTQSALLVEATSRVSAAKIVSTAGGSVLRGIGIEQYGPDFNTSGVPGGMLTIAAQHVRVENDVLTESASRGIVLTGKYATVVGSLFLSNGFTGMNASFSNNLDIEHDVFDNSNYLHWFDGYSAVAQAAGLKVAESSHVMVKGNTFTNNYGNGVWCDVSSSDVTYADNYAARNDRNGLYVEISDTALVASNLSIFNGQAGLKISGGTHVRVDDNTLANNATYQLSVHDDSRDQPDPAKRALGITWDTANNTLMNNILAAPNTGSIGPLVFTEDLDRPAFVEASTMIVGMDYDLFTRPTATKPSRVVWWTHAAPTPRSQYSTLAAFTGATGYEMHGSEVNGYTTSPIFTAPDQGNYVALTGGPASNTGAPLPADVAAAIGVPAGVTVDRGALAYPSPSE